MERRVFVNVLYANNHKARTILDSAMDLSSHVCDRNFFGVQFRFRVAPQIRHNLWRSHSEDVKGQDTDKQNYYQFCYP